MEIGFVINNVSCAPNFLHPTSAFSRIEIRPEDLLLSEDQFIDCYLRPLWIAARKTFFEMQEAASDSQS